MGRTFTCHSVGVSASFSVDVRLLVRRYARTAAIRARTLGSRASVAGGASCKARIQRLLPCKYSRVLLGGGQITTQALEACVRRGVRVAALRQGGSVRFVVGQPTGGNVHLRMALYRAVCDEQLSLDLSRAIVAAKLQNSRKVAARWARDEKDTTLADQMASRSHDIPGDFASHVRGGLAPGSTSCSSACRRLRWPRGCAHRAARARAVARKLAVYVRARLKRSRGWSGAAPIPGLARLGLALLFPRPPSPARRSCVSGHLTAQLGGPSFHFAA